jgi:ABC-type transport system involved in multi-copper enzyme maturation permease subunit
MQIWALIADSFREARDTKIFWVMTAISLVVVAAMFCVGIYPDRVDILFGAWQINTDRFAASAGVDPGTLAALGVRTDLVAGLAVDFILELVLGFIGMILAIIATAGFLPNMLARGTIDVLLSKPLPRWRLFLGRYLGSMMFILVQAVLFVGLSFVVMGTRWQVWLPGYLLTIPLIVLLFSYLYCVSAFVAVRFGSSTAAVLLTLGAWVFFAGIQSLDDAFDYSKEMRSYTRVRQTVNVARWIVPKTQDITYIAKRWTGAATASKLFAGSDDEAARKALADADEIELRRIRLNPTYTIGSSLLFEAALVLAAMWSFSRKDF